MFNTYIVRSRPQLKKMNYEKSILTANKKTHIWHLVFLAEAVILTLKKWHFFLSNFYAIKVLLKFPRRKHQYFHMISHIGFFIMRMTGSCISFMKVVYTYLGCILCVTCGNICIQIIYLEQLN